MRMLDICTISVLVDDMVECIIDSLLHVFKPDESTRAFPL
jgi:hypothetical protein